MTTWNEGYVVDVAYTEHVFGAMLPTWLSSISVINGQPPLNGARDLTYVELGCGNGLTSCLVAATMPHAEVWSCDFNPAHIERARQIATASGLTNCTFEEASFEEIAHNEQLGPPRADVIALHGVYSWISAENRRHVIDVVRRRLAPGGLVYVSYNVPTGWAAMLPVQHAMRLQVATDGRRSDLAMRGALATMHQLAEDGAAAFPLGPREQVIFDDLAAQDPAYVAHEFLGGSFSPAMFADVASEFERAKCSFVGSCRILDAFVEFRIPPGLRSLVVSTADVALRETIADLAVNAPFRADVYRRGIAPVHQYERGRWLDQLTLVGMGRPFDQTSEIPLDVGPIRLDEQHYAPLVEELLDGTLTGHELRSRPQLRDRGDAELATTIALLIAGGYAAPSAIERVPGENTEPTARFNAMLVDLARRGRSIDFLVAPAIGGPISLDTYTVLVVGEHWDGVALEEVALTDAVLQRIAGAGPPAPMPDNNDIRAITSSVTRAIGLLSGPFRRLGIRPPAKRGHRANKRR